VRLTFSLRCYHCRGLSVLVVMPLGRVAKAQRAGEREQRERRVNYVRCCFHVFVLLVLFVRDEPPLAVNLRKSGQVELQEDA